VRGSLHALFSMNRGSDSRDYVFVSPIVPIAGFSLT
jgi:hypothetical protein